jgi:hypothetical protein
MKGKELLDANPKAASLIHDFYLNAMLNALDDQSLPDNFKEFTREKGLPMENIAAMIDANPRQLFDVFDEHKIFIEILRDNRTGHFQTVVNEEFGNAYSIRKDAEKQAVEEAINQLESKLTDLVNDKKNS